MGQHRGRGSLTVGACYANSILIGAHNDAPGLRSFKHRNTRAAGCSDFRIIIMNGSSTNHAFCALDILLLMADINGNSFGNQLLC